VVGFLGILVGMLARRPIVWTLKRMSSRVRVRDISFVYIDIGFIIGAAEEWGWWCFRKF